MLILSTVSENSWIMSKLLRRNIIMMMINLWINIIHNFQSYLDIL